MVSIPEDIFGPEEKWYRYHSKWNRYPIDSEELVPVPVKVVPVPLGVSKGLFGSVRWRVYENWPVFFLGIWQIESR